ncbi:EAL domain-containing protein [Exilibacterium tricleocarpae]|uniref:EAL domain-containing protein n=1 Tax=Exilibacterium tricleocarpae TaxID=2591008 RepID=A0A545U5B7_9GAMM|nr:EAL domain-containing protein [Exilibacterium tricleocarpae]TQV84659.1 EAL domain-containing protein [Exilibacterium tricleocarpae]
MRIEFFNRIAFKLMRSSLAIALTLGVIVALVQVYMDLSDQRHAIDNNIQEIFRVTENPAQRAVHLLDSTLAGEVVKGLEYYNFLTYAAILDDKNQIMAEHRREPGPSGTLWLTQLLMDEIKQYELDLIYSDGTYEGRIVLRISNDLALAPFYARSTTIFISGLLRNMSLALVLMVLYHYALTRPLIQISNKFSTIRPDHTEGRRIDHVKGHKSDELGQIVEAANAFIATLEERQTGLTQSEQQLRIILDASPNQIFAVNKSGEFVFLNIATERFYGQAHGKLIGKNYYGIHKAISDKEANAILINIKRADSDKRKSLDMEQRLTDAKGVVFAMQMSYIPFDFYGESCVLVIGADITGRVEAEERVEHLAYFDTLTDLPNRNMLYDHLKMDISRCRRTGSYGALLFIDLDDFKRINDTLGHSLGDQLLLQLSQQMQSQKRQTDTLARLGGDEFILSLPDLHNDIDFAKQQATELAKRLLDRISTPITLENREFIISASIGIVIYPYGESDTESLLRFADTAMYKAKQSGRNCCQIFEESMATEANNLVQLESELRTAIQSQQFVLRVQPIIDGQSGKLAAAEALIRWNHPERGMVSPLEFIGFLESSGMIREVDQLVFVEVCQYIHALRSTGEMPEEFRFSVNLSASTLHRSDFVQRVESTLAQYNLPGTCIEFEITEGAALQRLDEVIQKLKVLQLQGLTFALDDFGTGYSSLSYLKRLPINKIKIDKSFIKDLIFDPQDEALVASVIAIADTLNLRVVAEGVESEDQAAWLNCYSDIWYQGYLFDRPLHPEAFREKYLQPQQTPRLVTDNVLKY